MKRLFFVMAAVAAMVGCSKESDLTNDKAKATFAINASIATDDTRVTVGGENNYTEVNWEQGDKIRVESAKGFNADLVAESSGRTDIRFVGDAYPVATTDTYYAVYPSSNISNATVTFYCDNQPGDDVAALVAMVEDVESNNIEMTFKPVNSLLHVSVSGVSSLKKAEFRSYTGETLPETFTYNYADDTVESNYPVDNSRESYEIENPSVGGFFFSLPADLDMKDGYIITLTDANGNVCLKAYNGKTFEKATTTHVDFEWTEPTVTLGAKTSYSYYLAGKSSIANSCANTDIFFVTGKSGESCASSYTGVQDAMITDLGYEVEGTTYTYSADQVSWDKENNKFCLKEEPAYTKTLGEKSGIRAFIVVNGKKVYSTNNLWLTGLPYGYNFENSSLAAYKTAGWTLNGTLNMTDRTLVARTTTLVLQTKRAGVKESGFIVSPKFYMPSNISIQASILRSAYYLFWGGSKTRTGYVGAVANNATSNTSSVTYTCSADSDIVGTVVGNGEWLTAFDITPLAPFISINCDEGDFSSTAHHYFLHAAHFRYAQ
ncbi:MAG: hypothetical protein IKB15_06445 [Alistipes sp.]|nr:hypothetical protein [Alistipes sp.]